ncbi:MAG: HTH domain-containing protein [Prevotella sp.]|nr:HTH domain-containing protein [Prevotella sp.]
MKASSMLTVTELSQETGIDRYLIWYYVRKLGIVGERVGAQRLMLMSPSDCERIKMACGKYQLEHGGATTMTQLAEELGVSRQTIWVTANKLDWKYLGKQRSKAIIGPVLADEIREAINDRKADK